MSTPSPEQVLSLADNEIVRLIDQDDGFAEYLERLLVEVYQDDTLAEVRTALKDEAVNMASVDCEWEKEWSDEDRQRHRETTYPLAFNPTEIIDIRVRVLAKVRCAIKRVCPAIPFQQGQKEPLQRAIKRTRDGDLAYRYMETDRDGGTHLAGEHALDAMLNWDIHFSPELQLAMVKGYGTDIWDSNAFMIDVLAQEDQLTLRAWEALLKRDDNITYRAVWITKGTRPEVMGMIMDNEKLALLYRARTDEGARAELLKRAADFPGILVKSWIENRDKSAKP